MNTIITNERFKGFRDRDSGARFTDLEFNGCHFCDCSVSLTLDPIKRSIFRRIQLTRCEVANCSVGPAILEDVTVDELKTAQLLIANACAYKHVVLKGQVGDIKICRWVPWVSGPAGMLARRQDAMDQANAEYYRTVDWALDISQANFSSGEVEGVPTELVRRDPKTQFVVKASAIKEGLWRAVDLTGTYWTALLSAYERKCTGDVILVAPKAAPDFGALLNGLVALRRAGVAEPD